MGKARVQKLFYTAILALLASIVMLPTAVFSDVKNVPAAKDIVPLQNIALPELAFKTADGEVFELTDKVGEITVLHFWASWCPPCITELPSLDVFAAKYKKKGVNFVVVSLDNAANQAKAAAFYEAHHIRNLPLLFGSQMEVMRALKLKGLPTSFFVKEQQIVGRADKDLEWSDAYIKAYMELLLDSTP